MFVKVSTGINILLLVLNACNFKIHGVTSYLVIRFLEKLSELVRKSLVVLPPFFFIGICL